jgi:hypothetical protein
MLSPEVLDGLLARLERMHGLYALELSEQRNAVEPA